MSSIRRSLWSLSIAAIGFPTAALAQTLPIGLEFKVNDFTLSAQEFAAVAADADGDFVVTWGSANNADGYAYGIFAHRFSSAGVALAIEFQVNVVTAGGQRIPGVAQAANGDFVIVWRGGGGSAYEIFGRRFSSSGTPLTGDFQVNTYSPNQQINPVVTAAAGGDFIVSWISDAQDGDSGGVFAQRFSSTGVASGSEFQVNSYTADYQRNPVVAIAPSGDFLIAWQSNLQDGSSFGVFGRRFSSAGTALGSEFEINAFTTGYQGNPSAAAGPQGDFAVFWENNTPDFGIFGQRISSAGVFLGTELQINVITTFGNRFPIVATSAFGDFVVTWQSDTREIFARRFSSAGAPLTGQFQVNTYTFSYQVRPAVAAETDGDFVVVWQSNGQDGSGYGIFGQRFAAIAALDIDGNGELTALTDGLLALRFFFGFTGNSLTTGAIGGMCTRCDAAAIEPYLTLLGLVLDIDGDQDAGALTDGLLALRYLFGFTGADLIDDAFDGGCSRCDAPAIEAYLLGLTT